MVYTSTINLHRKFIVYTVLLLVFLSFDHNTNTNCEKVQKPSQGPVAVDEEDSNGSESPYYSRPANKDGSYSYDSKNSASLTLLTISTGLTTEPLSRFVRTADFNGFREGYDLKIIDPPKKYYHERSHDWPLLSDSVKLTLLRKAINVLSKSSTKSQSKSSESSDSDSDSSSSSPLDKNQIILFVDSESSLILGNSNQIVSTFKKSGANILFSSTAEDTCKFYQEVKKRTNNNNSSVTPNDSDEKSNIVEVDDDNVGIKKPLESPLINFDGFIGYAQDLNQLFQHESSASINNFKELITSIYYGNEALRSSLGLALDVNSTIFYTIKSSDYKSKDINLQLNLDGTIIRPKLMKSNHHQPKSKSKQQQPVLIVQANVCKDRAIMPNAILNYYGNYLTPTLPEDKIKLSSSKMAAWPTITIGIFIEKPTPFVEEFFKHFEALRYNKSRLHLFIHNHFKYNVRDVDIFLNRSGDLYGSVKYIRSKERIKEWAARKLGVEHALSQNTDYYFSIDGTAHLENRDTLKLLVESHKLIVAPLLCYITTSTADLQTISKNFCNFWGTVNSDGLFTKSIDYKDISNSQHFGIWNVPYIASAYLIHSSILRSEGSRPSFIHGLDEADVAFATNNRNRGLFMFVSNEFEAGHLVNADYFELSHTSNELFQIFDNRYDWEKRYLHKNYYDVLSEEDYGGKGLKVAEPCQDVFWFPIVTERFAQEMINEMEGNGNWADGSIEARGDPYPTVDIQMSEIGFEWHFHEFMRLYIKPLQDLAFNGYEVYPPKTDQAFVVKYTAEDQRELKPHFDLSTYTINIALNTPHKDFEGGGCRFLRNNCSVIDTKIGWMMMHPGQFTHKHEGLKVTSGTRYILVAFIDP